MLTLGGKSATIKSRGSGQATISSDNNSLTKRHLLEARTSSICLRMKQIPIIGLAANQDGFLNRLGEIEYQFLSPRVDLKQVAKEAGIPFLVSIPQSGDSNKLKPYFSELAEKVIALNPIVLKDVTLAKKLKRKVIKGVARRL